MSLLDFHMPWVHALRPTSDRAILMNFWSRTQRRLQKLIAEVCDRAARLIHLHKISSPFHSFFFQGCHHALNKWMAAVRLGHYRLSMAHVFERYLMHEPMMMMIGVPLIDERGVGVYGSCMYT